VLGQELSWEHFNAHIEHALKYGYDHARGWPLQPWNGQSARDGHRQDLVVQSEMLAALCDGLKHKDNAEWSKALDSLLNFIVSYQADPEMASGSIPSLQRENRKSQQRLITGKQTITTSEPSLNSLKLSVQKAKQSLSSKILRWPRPLLIPARVGSRTFFIQILQQRCPKYERIGIMRNLKMCTSGKQNGWMDILIVLGLWAPLPAA
jgi:hypothetical protein